MARLGDAEFLRIEIIAGPPHEVAVVIVAGFGWRIRGLDQPLVAVDTATVFRRAASGATD